ncbi:MAG TPA: copper chaperone PCu(A)C [Acidimicrobiales bacterium]|nr:copper chaperone PCu(A)C [Acidimicrobiales bacterium]
MRRHHLIAALAALVLLLAACGDDDDTEGSDASATTLAAAEGAPDLMVAAPAIRVPAGPNTALYLEITNQGTVDDRLVAVAGPIGEEIQIHETTTDDEGRMSMGEVGGGILLPAGETVALQPGGLHVMILGVGELAVGDEIDMELRFEVSDPITVTAPVRDDIGSGMGDMDGDMDEMDGDMDDMDDMGEMDDGMEGSG